jgi:hypothetical protein
MKKTSSKICITCGKEFFKKSQSSHKDWDKQKYCSSKCWHDSKTTTNTGRTHFKKGENIGNTNGFKKGNLPWNKDKEGVMPEPWNKGKKIIEMSGVNHWNYKGGTTEENQKIRTSIEIKLFRKCCFERDNFTCQVSGQYGGDLVIHHINNFADFPEKRTEISNGFTMTKELHLDFHKKYGFRNNTREQLEEFIQNYAI